MLLHDLDALQCACKSHYSSRNSSCCACAGFPSHQTIVMSLQRSKIAGCTGNFINNILPPVISRWSTIDQILSKCLAPFKNNIYSFLSHLFSQAIWSTPDIRNTQCVCSIFGLCVIVWLVKNIWVNNSFGCSALPLHHTTSFYPLHHTSNELYEACSSLFPTVLLLVYLIRNWSIWVCVISSCRYLL